MAGTELIKATQASYVVNKGINGKFHTMSVDGIHTMIELKRSSEQVTEIPLTATRQ